MDNSLELSTLVAGGGLEPPTFGYEPDELPTAPSRDISFIRCEYSAFVTAKIKQKNGSAKYFDNKPKNKYRLSRPSSR